MISVIVSLITSLVLMVSTTALGSSYLNNQTDPLNEITHTQLLQEKTTVQDVEVAQEILKQELQSELMSELKRDGGIPITSPSTVPEFPPLPPISPYPPNPTYPTFPLPGTGGGGTQLDSIVNLALKLWDIIKEGRPVFNVTTMNANALPEGARSPFDLQGWVEKPKVAVYTIRFLNMFSSEIGHIKFRLMFTYGGNVRGKGKYLSSVKIVPDSVSVPWGAKLDAKVEVTNIIALGDPRNPTAQMELLVSHTMSSYLRSLSGSQSFTVKGDGSYREIGGF